MTVPFDDMCVPCGEVTMQISRALLVLEMFSLYLIQGYKSVLVSGIPVFVLRCQLCPTERVNFPGG